MLGGYREWGGGFLTGIGTFYFEGGEGKKKTKEGEGGKRKIVGEGVGF